MVSITLTIRLIRSNLRDAEGRQKSIDNRLRHANTQLLALQEQIELLRKSKEEADTKVNELNKELEQCYASNG